MASASAILTLINALQIPLTLFSELNLSGPLYPPERVVANNSCFDYIVVGGGTAGCAVAARLSENPDSTVLLLEAGGNPPALNFLPPAFALFPGSKYDYNYTSTFDSYAASSQYNYTKLSSGKGLGGTSFINHFILARGSKADYDTWAEIVNDESWNYENVLPYFKKKERLVDEEILNSNYSEVHGLDGPNAIKRQPKEYGEKYIGALDQIGRRTPLDITDEVSLGYAQSLLIVDRLGIRQNTAYTYLSKIRMRENLYVRRHSQATRIIFEGNRAVAVVTVQKGVIYVFRASKEIILSAGVFNSPKLLLLSGVGPKKHLRNFNIPLKADLPVGDNFQDQIAISLVHRMELMLTPPPLTTLNPLQVPFPIIVGEQTLKRSQEFADYQMFLLPLFANSPFLELACAVVFQFRADICDEFNKANKNHNTLYSLLLKTQPKSRGTVRLRSTDPSKDPLITTGYLTNSSDLDDMAEYIEDFLKIERSRYFRRVNARLVRPKLRECNRYRFRSRNYWKCYVRHTAGSAYHNGGTCAMGSVVDSRLKVYNVTNLRVVDASVIPILPNGSPYEAVLMIAEKASDMIKEDNDNESSCRASESTTTPDFSTTTESLTITDTITTTDFSTTIEDSTTTDFSSTLEFKTTDFETTTDASTATDSTLTDSTTITDFSTTTDSTTTFESRTTEVADTTIDSRTTIDSTTTFESRTTEVDTTTDFSTTTDSSSTIESRTTEVADTTIDSRTTVDSTTTFEPRTTEVETTTGFSTTTDSSSTIESRTTEVADTTIDSRTTVDSTTTFEPRTTEVDTTTGFSTTTDSSSTIESRTTEVVDTTIDSRTTTDSTTTFEPRTTEVDTTTGFSTTTDSSSTIESRTTEEADTTIDSRTTIDSTTTFEPRTTEVDTTIGFSTTTDSSSTFESRTTEVADTTIDSRTTVDSTTTSEPRTTEVETTTGFSTTTDSSSTIESRTTEVADTTIDSRTTTDSTTTFEPRTTEVDTTTGFSTTTDSSSTIGSRTTGVADTTIDSRTPIDSTTTFEPRTTEVDTTIVSRTTIDSTTTFEPRTTEVDTTTDISTTKD